MNNIVPSFLRAPTETFSPQTLHVGDTFQLNNSVFSYTIVNTFDAVENGKLVSSFPYYNNPFSNGCDVTNLTVTVTRTLGDSPTLYQYYGYSASGFITCTRPTLFQMTWGLPIMNDGLTWWVQSKITTAVINKPMKKMALYSGVLGVNDAPYGNGVVQVTVRPCCNCTMTLATTSIEAESDCSVSRSNTFEPGQFRPSRRCKIGPGMMSEMSGMLMRVCIASWMSGMLMEVRRSNASFTARTPNPNAVFGSGKCGTLNLNSAFSSVWFRFEPIPGPDLPSTTESASLLEPPCSTEPTRLIRLGGFIQNTTAPSFPWGYSYTWNGSNITDLFSGTVPVPEGYIGSQNLSVLDVPFQNLFQALYHLVRCDLGVILGNQIYSSPDMFNGSVVTIAVPQDLLGQASPFGAITPSFADTMRAATSNETLMAQWRDSVLAFNSSNRVPVLEYLRPIPRLKPLGSAITSVFVATFTMVSAVWTIFSMVARSLVRSHRDDSDTVPLRERFNVSFSGAKRSFEGLEAAEACSLTAEYRDPVYTDDRLNILLGQVATLIRRVDHIENNLRSQKRGTVDNQEPHR
ncbi:hypothetical protein B0H12DRAFT_1070435 [Mycena haematopus]|nr:hypothetical protein B0H12DRAFT_1070435 [Mycena haematopus]